jgi:hypothetical protein
VNGNYVDVRIWISHEGESFNCEHTHLPDTNCTFYVGSIFFVKNSPDIVCIPKVEICNEAVASYERPVTNVKMGHFGHWDFSDGASE